MDQIVIANAADFHTHLRGANGDPGTDPKLLRADAILHAIGKLQGAFSRVLAMPNLLHTHIQTAQEIGDYLLKVKNAIPEGDYVEPLMTISLKPTTTPEIIEECAKIPEFKAVKYYPGGVTTNSGGSSEDINPDDPKVQAVFEKMAELGIALSLHPETTEKKDSFGHITKGFVHDAEREFRTLAERIAYNHPNLKIVIEHISTKEMAELVGSGKYPNLYGSVTPQHLLYTAHDKEGGHALEPHLHCKPTLKNPEDLIAIQKLVLSGNDHVFLGTDSAPHPQDTKECAHCASGVFSSPIAIQTITSWFMDKRTHSWWQNETGETLQDNILQLRLQNFMGTNGQAIYGKPNVDKFVTLERSGFEIPGSYPTKLDDVRIIPMDGGKSLPWSISNIQVQTGSGVTKTLDIAPLGQIFS